MAKARWTILAMLAALVVAILALGGTALAHQEGTSVFPSATAQKTQDSDQQLRVEKPGSGNPGPLSATQKLAMKQGYLVPDQDAYERAKAAAQRHAAGEGKTIYAAAQGADPETFRSWEGIRNRKGGTPSDSTGAIGPTRYIELINVRYAIYDRTSNRPLNTGTLNELVGEPPPPPPGEKKGVKVFDPQIIWDSTTRRFYYVALDVYSAIDNRLAFGFSKTASPSSAADFCKYVIKFGPRLPDYPKLGDTEDLLLIGANTFLSSRLGAHLGSDLVSITKPSAGSGCPGLSEFTVDIKRKLRDAAGRRASTPVPANQIDPAQGGYVVATPPDASRGGFARSLSVYGASSGADGSLKLGAPKRLKVPFYTIPATAPQPRSNYRIDTLWANITQAILAKDPSRGGKVALWTQHTVLGGSGAEVRWYEIDPTSKPSLFQKGTISGPNGLYAFNGAISPDRQVNGGTSRFGANMVVGFNTSSTEQRPDIRMVSKQGSAPVSDQVLIKSSPSVLEDFACVEMRVCRWGDYSAATPDPNVPAGATTGRVWLTN